MLAFILKRKIVSFVILILLLGGGYYCWTLYSTAQSKPTYQTAPVTKGDLVVFVSTSGQVTTGNNLSITTQASGIIKDVLVKNGDTVKQGQVIANITLDQTSQQKQASSWASYQSARASLDSANNNLNTLQNTSFVANQKFINDAVARGLTTSDPIYIEENATWLAAESAYKNQQTVISQAQSSLNGASLSFQQSSSAITAPLAGVVTGLTIAPGSQVVSQSSSSTTTTSQTLGSIIQPGPLQAQVNLSEIDSVSVNPDQKVTMTLDAFPGKTFTGKVASINTNGVVSSGVTTYPVTITFDTSLDHIYPNMGVSAKIVTKIDSNVLIVPSSAIQNTGGENTVRILNNGTLQSIPVTILDASDTQTAISSGVSEGDQVVTAIIAAKSGTSTGATTSPFGAAIRGGGGAGGRRPGG